LKIPFSFCTGSKGENVALLDLKCNIFRFLIFSTGTKAEKEFSKDQTQYLKRRINSSCFVPDLRSGVFR
jgi:hypothetical protein